MSRTTPTDLVGHKQNSQLNSLCTAVASGDIGLVKQLLEGGAADPNSRAFDGSLPLCTAAFWGYADIVDLLLEHNANINGCNTTTGWTAAHCAAFQGHGRVLLFLTKHNPDLTIKDTLGRTAVDFASAQEQIWPFFSVMGCTRTSKEQLIKLDVIEKATVQSDSPESAGVQKSERIATRYSRPGSSYVLSLKAMASDTSNLGNKPSAAKLYGDVLSEES